jgi:hypothetical protein
VRDALELAFFILVEGNFRRATIHDIHADVINDFYSFLNLTQCHQAWQSCHANSLHLEAIP